MSKFIEMPASKNSLSNRKLVYGVGINDANYLTQRNINGKWVQCHYYTYWTNMIKRCYSEKYHKIQPTYKDCIVCEEWLTFSSFKKWMQSQDWNNKALDKDVINPNNNIYDEKNCIFIDQSLNSLLLNMPANRGNYPCGVCWYKSKKRFIAYCNVNGKRKHLGYFNDQHEASEIYKKFKSQLVTKIANEQTDERIKNGLLKHVELILKG